MTCAKSVLRTALLGALAAAGAGIAGDVLAQRRRARRPTLGKAIHTQRYARKQFEKLIVAMHQVSMRLEKTDPDTAAAIAAAAQQAQAALIADNMKEVVKLLVIV